MGKNFYTQTWFICLMFAFWFLIIPLIAGIVFLIMQWIEQKKVLNLYGEIDTLQSKKEKLISETKIEQNGLLIKYESERRTLLNKISNLNNEIFNTTNELLLLKK